MNFYQHHIGDFNNATRHLTRVEQALYRELLDMYYDKESPIPNGDFNALARKMRCKSDEEMAALTIILDEFFVKGEGGYHNARADSEIEKYQAMLDSRSAAGKASAKSRQNKRGKLVPPNPTKANKRLTRVEQEANKIQLTKNQEPRTKNKKNIKKKTTLPKGFGVNGKLVVWGVEKGWSINELHKHMDYFTTVCKAKGYEYVDWRAAFQNAVNKNWANIKQQNTGNGKFVPA